MRMIRFEWNLGLTPSECIRTRFILSHWCHVPRLKSRAETHWSSRGDVVHLSTRDIQIYSYICHSSLHVLRWLWIQGIDLIYRSGMNLGYIGWHSRRLHISQNTYDLNVPKSTKGLSSLKHSKLRIMNLNFTVPSLNLVNSLTSQHGWSGSWTIPSAIPLGTHSQSESKPPPHDIIGADRKTCPRQKEPSAKNADWGAVTKK